LIEPDSKAHDYVMIHQGRCLCINNTEVLNKLFKEKKMVVSYLAEVLLIEKRFLKNYYSSIGSDATSNIVNGLLEYSR
jgi:hypothetical protein